MTSDGGIPGGYFAERDGEAAAERRLCFIAPGADVGRSYTVFFNLEMHEGQHVAYGPLIARTHRVSRVWSKSWPLDTSPGVDSPERWQEAVDMHVHHIATDAIDDPWSRTDNPRGWPFRCMTGDCRAFEEQLGAEPP